MLENVGRRTFGLFRVSQDLIPCLLVMLLPIFFQLNDFSSSRKLRRYAGVVPTCKESGNKVSRGRIPKISSRKLLRWALIQAANTIGKTDTKLGRYYRRTKPLRGNLERLI